MNVTCPKDQCSNIPNLPTPWHRQLFIPYYKRNTISSNQPVFSSPKLDQNGDTRNYSNDPSVTLDPTPKYKEIKSKDRSNLGLRLHCDTTFAPQGRKKWQECGPKIWRDRQPKNPSLALILWTPPSGFLTLLSYFCNTKPQNEFCSVMWFFFLVLLPFLVTVTFFHQQNS